MQAMPACAPVLSKTIRTPALSSACCIATRLFEIGVRRRFSKSLTVLNDTFAASASCCWVQSSQPRAALLCSGVICDIKQLY